MECNCSICSRAGWKLAFVPAASIGQVHRAQLGTQAVAVKVQYPGIEDVLRSDLKKADILARLATFGTAFDGKGLARELSERVLEECDYRQEALNQVAFAKLFAGIKGAHVPSVIATHSTHRVLTSEFVEAARFQDFCDEAPQEARDRAGAIIFRTCHTTEYVEQSYDLLIFENPNRNRSGMPPQWLFPSCVAARFPRKWLRSPWPSFARPPAAAPRPTPAHLPPSPAARLTPPSRLFHTSFRLRAPLSIGSRRAHRGVCLSPHVNSPQSEANVIETRRFKGRLDPVERSSRSDVAIVGGLRVDAQAVDGRLLRRPNLDML